MPDTNPAKFKKLVTLLKELFRISGLRTPRLGNRPRSEWNSLHAYAPSPRPAATAFT